MSMGISLELAPDLVNTIYILMRDKARELREVGVTVNFYPIRQSDRVYLDGIATVPFRTVPFIEFMERISNKHIPTAFFNENDNFAKWLCYVGCDYVQSGRVAAGLICASGMGEIGVLTSGGADIYSFTSECRALSKNLSSW